MKHALIALALAPLLAHAAGEQEQLFKAAELDRPGFVAGLLAQTDPNGRNERGETALLVALKYESWDTVTALLADQRLTVDTANAAGETALMLAALKGRLELAKLLVARGAKINRPGWTPLHYACSGPDMGVASWLLEQGANIDAQAPNGSTALMMAVRYAPPETAELLLAKGANTQLKHENGRSAADFAEGAGRITLAARIRAQR